MKTQTLKGLVERCAVRSRGHESAFMPVFLSSFSAALVTFLTGVIAFAFIKANMHKREPF